MGLLSSLFDPGRDDRRAAASAAERGRFTRANIFGPLGISGGFENRGGVTVGTSSLGAFDPVARHFLSAARGGPALDLGFLDPLFTGAIGDLSGRDIPTSRDFESSLGRLPSATGPNITANAPGSMEGFSGLGSVFSAALPIANADPFALGAGVTERLRAGALPENQRLVNSTFDRLFASGRLGTTGGANIAGRLQESLNQQDLGFQQAGLEAGRGLQSDALGRLMSAFGGQEAMAGRLFGEGLAGEQLRTGTALSAEQLAQARQFGVESAAQGRDQLAMANLSRMFSEGLSTAGMRAQFAGQRAGLGTSLANTLLQNLVTGQNLGLSSLQAATGLAQLPLAFQSAALAGEATRSGAEFNQAAILQGNAKLAKSPLLEAVNAIGQFFQPIKFPGTGGSEGGG